MTERCRLSWMICDALVSQTRYDKTMGARPMARLIQESIKRPLADAILFGDLAGGGSVLVTIDKKRTFVRYDTSRGEIERNSVKFDQDRGTLAKEISVPGM